MENKVLERHPIVVGDIIEIVDAGGGSAGNVGDRCQAQMINEKGRKDTIIEGLLLDGNQKGMLSRRYAWRYKLIQSEWDF